MTEAAAVRQWTQGLQSGSAAEGCPPELKCGSGSAAMRQWLQSGNAAEAAALRQRDVSGAIYMVRGYHRRFLIRTVCDN